MLLLPYFSLVSAFVLVLSGINNALSRVQQWNPLVEAFVNDITEGFSTYDCFNVLSLNRHARA